MISKRQIDQAFSDLHDSCGGVRDDYFGLLYLELEHGVPREKAVNQVAFGGHDYGFDGFHFDPEKRNLYLFQFKNSDSYSQFKDSLQRLIDDGIQRVFAEPNRDDAKNQMLLQLRSCLLDNRALIEQVCFRFVFTGDPEEAERSTVLEKLRDDLEDKKFLVDRFFEPRKVGFVVEFRSATGRVGVARAPRHASFEAPFTDFISRTGPDGQEMHVGFMRLADLDQMRRALDVRFFDRNIRYGLGEGEAVNRAISTALRRIVLDGVDDPSAFPFHHNGITIYAEDFRIVDSVAHMTAPRLLNGAQTVTTLKSFLEKHKDNPALAQGKARLEEIRVLCRVITRADSRFITQVTINNNRQNPVEPWNLHANDLIQLELQEKFKDDLEVYYERQENAFDQLTSEDLEEYGIREESKAIQMLKLTQVFLLTDGQVSRLSEMRRVFEDDKVYDQVFRRARLNADSRQILLCYKINFNLKKYAKDIEQKGQNKYWFISRARNLLWALLCQGLLNDDDLETLADEFGTSMSVPVDYKNLLTSLATTRVRVLLSELMADPHYADKVQEQNLSFLRTDRAFDRCMELAHKKWRWVHKKLA